MLVHVYTYIYTHYLKHTCVFAHIDIATRACMYIYTYTHVQMHMYIYKYLYIYIYIHTYICIYVRVTCTDICFYIYIYISYSTCMCTYPQTHPPQQKIIWVGGCQFLDFLIPALVRSAMEARVKVDRFLDNPGCRIQLVLAQWASLGNMSTSIWHLYSMYHCQNKNLYEYLYMVWKCTQLGMLSTRFSHMYQMHICLHICTCAYPTNSSA